jgi:hypothetical protein
MPLTAAEEKELKDLAAKSSSTGAVLSLDDEVTGFTQQLQTKLAELKQAKQDLKAAATDQEKEQAAAMVADLEKQLARASGLWEQVKQQQKAALQAAAEE